ncbi:MAG: hypothetical protein AB7F19_04080 [Candidatus Babeliales bacterium]
MKHITYFFLYFMCGVSAMRAEISAHPIERGPFEVEFINKTEDKINIFVRTASFDQEAAREYVHFKDGKWVYSAQPGPLETLIAPGFSSHTVPAGASFKNKFAHMPTLITVKSAGEEAAKSVPGTFALKAVIITEDPTGLVLNFK